MDWITKPTLKLAPGNRFWVHLWKLAPENLNQVQKFDIKVIGEGNSLVGANFIGHIILSFRFWSGSIESDGSIECDH